MRECTPSRSQKLGVGIRRSNYSGLSPSVSNCWLHSVGGSRSRSMPMPRGRQPSTAAFTRLGARKAREMVILTCRTLHCSRAQSYERLDVLGSLELGTHHPLHCLSTRPGGTTHRASLVRSITCQPDTGPPDRSGALRPDSQRQ